MSVWSKRSGISWLNDLSSERGTSKQKNSKLSTKAQISENKEKNYKISRLCKLLKKLHPQIIRKNRPFDELIKSEKPAKIDHELITNFETINKSLEKTCDLCIKQPLLNCTEDASKTEEDIWERKQGKKRK